MNDLYIYEGTNFIFMYRRHCDSDVELHRVFYMKGLDALWVIVQNRMSALDVVCPTCLSSFLNFSHAIYINPCLVVQAVANPHLILGCSNVAVICEDVVIE